jgi:hypothetical protein
MHKKNGSPRILCKVLLALSITLCSMSLGMGSGVHAVTNKEALNAVVHFLKAQKQCNVEEMLNQSDHLQKISNLKELYTKVCEQHPLQKATITDFSMVNENIALASVESTYKERIVINTIPVIKKEGQWTIIRGIPDTGHVKLSRESNKNTNEKEVNQALNNFSNAVQSGNLQEMKQHLHIMPEVNHHRLKKHLKALSEEPTPEITTMGIHMISDSVAIARIKTKYDSFSYTHNRLVFKENGQWKIVFGPALMNAGIPRGDKPIEIK